MNNWNRAFKQAACCAICLTIAPVASADFVGVTTVYRDDPDTEFLCTQGNGEFVPGPLTVCNVYAAFDHPADRLHYAGGCPMVLQVYNGAKPDVFFHHPIDFYSPYPPPCIDIPDSPDLICDSFVTIGPKCTYEGYGVTTDGDFQQLAFLFSGQITGGWHTQAPDNGQGDAGNYPDLEVLVLQSSVAQGRRLSGNITICWQAGDDGESFCDQDVPVECAAVCPEGDECDDGDFCTEDDQCIGELCVGSPIDCADRNVCTDDYCDPDSGCINEPNSAPGDDGDACTENDICVDGAPSGTPVQCPKGQSCDPANGECVDDHDPCECVDGRVTLCHVPPGNLRNAHTIIVGCAARDKHLAHGDTCGPCE